MGPWLTYHEVGEVGMAVVGGNLELLGNPVLNLDCVADKLLESHCILELRATLRRTGLWTGGNAHEYRKKANRACMAKTNGEW